MEAEDSNCCFVFKKYPNENVFICSSEELRCYEEVKVITKKFYLGCKKHFNRNKPTWNM